MDYDAIVVGGGIIGLAIAREIAMTGGRVAVLEAERALGQHATSRNSEVVHAGIYYPPQSLKATTCITGRRLLLEYCAAHGVATRTPGKLIVACTDAEIAALDRIAANASACGVELDRLDAAEVRAHEPAVSCKAALLSPTTAIVDSHALVAAIAGEVRDHGGDIVLGCAFRRATRTPDGLDVTAGDARVSTRALYLAAGARSPALAAAIEGFAPAAIPRAWFAKGSYFTVTGRPRFEGLVYPVPVAGGLGIHVTLDMAGDVRLGPDVEWTDDIDYAVDERKAEQFASAVARYAPDIAPADLRPGYAGVRAKIVEPGAPAGDFVVATSRTHTVPGVVALFGIESPGLTASLALARHALAAATA
jgi:L-2-hydroxyglutarate oxidase LhgO